MTKFELYIRSALLVKELESKIEDLKQHLIDQSILGAEVVDLKPFGIIRESCWCRRFMHIY